MLGKLPKQLILVVIPCCIFVITWKFMVKRKQPKSRDMLYPWDTCGTNLQEKDLSGLPEICTHLFQYNKQFINSLPKQLKPDAQSKDLSVYEEMIVNEKEDEGEIDKEKNNQGTFSRGPKFSA